MTDPTPVATVEVPANGDTVIPVTFAVNRLVVLGALGMAVALAIVLFQVMQERDKYREALHQFHTPSPHTANGKHDGPPDATPAPDVTAEVRDVSEA